MRYFFLTLTVLAALALGLSGCANNSNLSSNTKSSGFFLNSDQINTLVTNKTIVGKFTKNSQFSEYFERTLLEDKSYKLIEYSNTSSQKKNIKKGTWFVNSDKLCYMKPQIKCENIYFDGDTYHSVRAGKVWATFVIKDK